MAEKCYGCGNPVSENARFCGRCATQVTCKSCGEDLVEEAIVCEMCGEDVIKRQAEVSASAPNHIQYSDIKKGITLDARITDTFGANAAAIVGMIRGNQLPTRFFSPPTKGPGHQEELFDTADVVDDSLKTPMTLAPAAQQAEPISGGHSSSPLQALFEQGDEEWILTNPALKAKSKADFVKRATCLFLQFQQDSGVKPVPRGDVIKLLQNCSAYDTNARDWFAKEKSLIHSSSAGLTLLLPGKEYVTQILQEVTDDSIINSWKVGTVRKSSRKSSSKKERPTPSAEQAD